jgi:cell volume regulation protein A
LTATEPLLLYFLVVLGNEGSISNFLRSERTRNVIVDGGLKRFQEEIAFFVRSFFFVYLGLIAVGITINSVFWGVILSFLLLFIRYIAIRLATFRNPLSEKLQIMSVVMTRGLVAAILATLPMQCGLLYADLYLNVTLAVIISTAIFSTVRVFLLSS